MSYDKGTPIIAPFYMNAGKLLDSRGKMATIAERNAIPEGIRTPGLMVYVDETHTSYQLINGITNNDWHDIMVGKEKAELIETMGILGEKLSGILNESFETPHLRIVQFNEPGEITLESGEYESGSVFI